MSASRPDSPVLSRRTALQLLGGSLVGSIWGSSLLVDVPFGTGVAEAAGPGTSLGWRFTIGGYGPLVADPNQIIDLPVGFRAVTLAAPNSTRLADGVAIPGRPDAMGSFTVGATTVIAVNHELSTGDGDPVPRTNGDRGVATYDAKLNGGVSLIVLDADANVIAHRPVLSGTGRNCAGGVTPWGTWLTCEETEVTIDATPHGYVFEVDPSGTRTDAVPYRAMGRFAHEAAAVDPTTSEVYLTEDNGSKALLYKFIPTDRSQRFGSLGRGGTLLAMRVPGIADFGDITTVGTTITGVTWTPTPNPDGIAVPQDVTDLRLRFDDARVTRGQKLEGVWFHDGTLTFVSSFNDSISQPIMQHEGQIFRYNPATASLTLLAYIPVGGRQTVAGETLSRPDNVTVSRFGGVMWCEDGNDPNGIGGLDASGEPFMFARSRQPGELCGVHFSPDGRWLFVNQQNVGRTLAITGPWSPASPAQPAPAPRVAATKSSNAAKRGKKPPARTKVGVKKR